MTPRSPALQKLLNKGRRGNPLDRLADLEQKSMGGFLREPKAQTLTEICGDLGFMVSGAFISPTVDSVSCEPTSTDFVGCFQCGAGFVFGSSTYQMGGTNAGTLHWGAANDGKLYAGAGAVTLDADGIKIEQGTGNPNQIKFYDAGALIGSVSVSAQGGTGGTPTAYIWSGTTQNSEVRITAAYAANQNVNLYLVTSSHLAKFWANGTGSAVDLEVEGGLSVNSSGADVDTTIKGDTTTVVTVDAGLEQAIITKLKVSGWMSIGASSELTIAGGVVTATQSNHSIDTQADAASDDLDTINGGTGGDILVLRSENSARDVTVKDGTGNIYLAGDCVLDNIQDTLVLKFLTGLGWVELSRSSNA